MVQPGLAWRLGILPPRPSASRRPGSSVSSSITPSVTRETRSRGDLGAVDVYEMVRRGRWSSSPRVKAERRVVEDSQPARVLRHHGRGEAVGPIPRHDDPHLADVGARPSSGCCRCRRFRYPSVHAARGQMLGELDIERRFQTPLGQPRQQLTRGRSARPLRSRRRDQPIGQSGQISAAVASAVGRPSVVVVLIHDFLRPTTRSRGGHAGPLSQSS